MTTLRASGRTDVGQLRENNEDVIVTTDCLALVADGMGGHPGGEIAAEVVAGVVPAAFTGQSVDELEAAIRAANWAIRDRAVAQSGLEGMGTTICAAGLLTTGHVALVNVGDSRAYLWHEGALSQLTRDHSLTAELIESGELREEEATQHPYYGILTRALGVASDVEIDRTTLAVEEGDRIIICSDGLFNELSGVEIESAIAEGGEVAAIADNLIDRAITHGGRDNVSVGRPDQGYERTRAFYMANGFRPLEEFPNIWGPEDPALQMVKTILRPPGHQVTGSSDIAGRGTSDRLLVLVTGAPGTGKSTVADAAGRLLGAAVLSHDWAMSGLRPYPELSETLDTMDPPGHRAVGWSIVCALARAELRRDRPVVLDGVAREPEVALCRRIADEEGGRILLLATECSDAALHRQRVEGRQRNIPGWYELDWDDVTRARATWRLPRQTELTLDAARPWEDNAVQLRDVLNEVIRVRWVTWHKE